MNRLLLTLLTTILSLAAMAQVQFRFTEVEALPPIINSEYEENSPVFDPISQRLYFSRTLHPDNKGGAMTGQDLWYSELRNGNWTEPSNDLKHLNNYLNNAVVGISEDGERMYMLGTYIKKVELQSGFSVTRIDEDGDWPRPSVMDLPRLNIKSPFYGGFMHPDEDVMIISMESSESKGQEDLYVSIKTADGWSKPIWLGDSVNSSGFEISPFLYNDKKTLMFASNGMGGEGDCDIFYSYRLDSSWTNWSKPVNAGSKINSPGFDAFPFASGETFFFSSNRNDSLSNIYRAENELYFKEADILRLAFQSFDSRVGDLSVQVRDENDDVVGTFHPGVNDVVSIPGLREKKDYTLAPSHPLLNLKLFDPVLLNKDGAVIDTLSYDDDGNIIVRPELPEAIASKPVIQQDPPIPGMQGVFEVDKTPLSGIMLALVDENGEVKQYTKTTSGGKFSFAETPDDMNLKIQIISELEYIKNKGTIYYTDDLGNKLFKSVVDDNGEFKYQKLAAREMAQLKMLANDQGRLKESNSASKGVFSYENLPQDGVTLQLYDEEGNLVEEVVTDANGEFQFTKLSADKNFQIRPADGGLAAGDIAFLDDSGNRMSILEEDASGFQFRALRPEIVRGLQLMAEDYDDDRLDQNFVFTIGLYKYKSLPKDGIRLNLIDENDQIIETVTTDASGHFVFSMLKPDQKYRVQVVGVSDTEMDETQLYFVDNNGNVNTAFIDTENYYSFEELSKDYYFNISQINSDEAKQLVVESFKDVIGRFDYQDLPKSGVKLELLDENGKVIETVLTDENGNFIFSKLAKESEYFVRISEEDESLMAEADFVFENEENEELLKQGKTKQGFKFVTLARDDGSIAGMRLTENPELDIEKFLPKDINSSAPRNPGDDTSGTKLDDIERNDLRLQTIYFNFNSVRLSNNDRYRLNHNVFPEVVRSGQPILIVGYSCDIGDAKAAAQVSKLRAEMVKQYLVNLGMDPDRIIVEGIGAPDATLTYSQRLQRRRADIFHLVP